MRIAESLSESCSKNLERASLLSRDGFTEAAISRGYYAAFYLAQAALATKDISRSKHSGVIAAFGEHLTKKGFLPATLHKTFLDLYEKRITSDYSAEAVSSPDETNEALDAAAEFTNAVEIYLRKWLKQSPEA